MNFCPSRTPNKVSARHRKSKPFRARLCFCRSFFRMDWASLPPARNQRKVVLFHCQKSFVSTPFLSSPPSFSHPRFFLSYINHLARFLPSLGDCRNRSDRRVFPVESRLSKFYTRENAGDREEEPPKCQPRGKRGKRIIDYFITLLELRETNKEININAQGTI